MIRPPAAAGRKEGRSGEEIEKNGARRVAKDLPFLCQEEGERAEEPSITGPGIGCRKKAESCP
jgi:hypothetical protein